jgi:adenosylcobinamide-GDP ribazoletransferase
MIEELAAAIAFLTRFRLPSGFGRPTSTGAAAFPLVGAGLGFLAALPIAVFGDRAPLLAGSLAVAILAAASGAFHLDGLADTADALAAATHERAERARRDPRVGAAGAVAIAVAVLVDAAALAALEVSGGARAAALCCVAAGAVSRAMAPIAAVAISSMLPHRSAEPPPIGLGAAFVGRVTRRDATIAAGIALLVVAGLAAAAGVIELAAGLVAAAAGGLGLAAWLGRIRGRLDGDGFGSIIEIAFAAYLVGAVAVGQALP